MLKRDELSNPASCLNRAADNELVFVLLARDPAAAATVASWCNQRLLLGKNLPGDPQIQDALSWAETVQRQHLEGKWGKGRE